MPNWSRFTILKRKKKDGAKISTLPSFQTEKISSVPLLIKSFKCDIKQHWHPCAIPVPLFIHTSRIATKMHAWLFNRFKKRGFTVPPPAKTTVSCLMISKALGESNYSTRTQTHTIPECTCSNIYIKSEVIFPGDSGRACGIFVPLLWNDKVAVCYCSALLCLIVSLSCSSSTSLINSILVFFSSSLPVSQTWVFCWRKAHLTQIWSINKENARTTFPAESDSLQSFSSLLTLKSRDWNTENGSLHSRSFVRLFLRRFCKPQRRTLSAAAVFFAAEAIP